MLIGVKTDHAHLLSSVRAVVVDEVHAFADDDRGWRLLAVLERVAGLPVQRIGLSATVGNPQRLLPDLVCPAQCQRCLSGAGGAGYHVYRDDERTAVLAGENGVQLAELIGAVDESPYASR